MEIYGFEINNDLAALICDHKEADIISSEREAVAFLAGYSVGADDNIYWCEERREEIKEIIAAAPPGAPRTGKRQAAFDSWVRHLQARFDKKG